MKEKITKIREDVDKQLNEQDKTFMDKLIDNKGKKKR